MLVQVLERVCDPEEALSLTTLVEVGRRGRVWVKNGSGDTEITGGVF